MRRALSFSVGDAMCAATLDEAGGSHGLLIVSGGNELRCGAHRGMARLAAQVAQAGHPVLRFDRRGVGDSEGENRGFEHSAEDIAAAIALFRRECPHVTRITAFGNCDAATALILHHHQEGPDALLLANPWTIDAVAEAEDADALALPPADAIRARYARKLRDPREWLRLLRGGVDFAKLWRGIRAASAAKAPALLAARVRQALERIDVPVTILIAERDATALAFMAHWTTTIDTDRDNFRLERIDSASHSFADIKARAWLEARVLEALANEAGHPSHGLASRPI
jgi:exosortase A-associated hydrolase 1